MLFFQTLRQYPGGRPEPETSKRKGHEQAHQDVTLDSFAHLFLSLFCFEAWSLGISYANHQLSGALYRRMNTECVCRNARRRASAEGKVAHV